MNGCRHSTDKMDTINFLLTEVSLGLLGNSFFDIHGNNVKSLNLLVSKQSSQHIERTPGEVPLLKKLKLSEQHIAKGIYAQKLKAAQFHPYKKPEKLRRLSHSDISSTNAPPPVNIPAKPQSARIRERRSTCIGERPTAIALAPPKPVGKQIVIIKPPGMNANRPPLEILQRDLKIGNSSAFGIMSECQQQRLIGMNLYYRNAKHDGRLESGPEETSPKTTDGWFMQQCSRGPCHFPST